MRLSLRQRITTLVKKLKADLLTVYCLGKNPHTPMIVKFLAIFTAAYALSPIDLIPDFIPILGLLDDLIIVPLGIYWVLRYTPLELVKQARLEAESLLGRPTNRVAAVVIVMLWLLLVGVLVALYRLRYL